MLKISQSLNPGSQCKLYVHQKEGKERQEKEIEINECIIIKTGEEKTL